MSVQSFSAICDSTTHTLVLGTMPGVASINASEYYAHQRNAFWPIMMAITTEASADYALPKQVDYPARITQLLNSGIGLWDVLAECEREGSLDSAIKSDSVVVNDFVALLVQYPRISTIAFNGKAAQKLFKRHVTPMLAHSNVNTETIRWLDLPSTSPAMASLSLDQKYEKWRTALDV